MISLKEGVRVHGLKPELVLALMVAEQVFANHGSDLIITSVVDGKHSRESIHYIGMAVDLRIWHLGSPEEATNDLQKALGEDFDVVLESDHIHLEYQPKQPYVH